MRPWSEEGNAEEAPTGHTAGRTLEGVALKEALPAQGGTAWEGRRLGQGGLAQGAEKGRAPPRIVSQGQFTVPIVGLSSG